jgi:SAM-dependent methyltransferase
MTPERLEAVTAELLTRPGHEKVRSLLYDVVVNGMGIPSEEIDFERQLPEVKGRADALLGSTVIEVKRDLRSELRDAEEELGRYLTDREAATGRRFLGIATDGARFLTYEMRDGALEPLGRSFAPILEAPNRLLGWLDTVLAVRADLEPTPRRIRTELGRESLSYARSRDALGQLWSTVEVHQDARLKRDLWADLLQRVYGSRVDADELWFQHTYLVIVAKTMAIRVLDLHLTNARDLLSGQPFADASIAGAVQSDFFDWVLDAPGGTDLVMRIANQVARFRLASVEHDILKVLYESLIDPSERHELGEFYTPDWLAQSMCETTIEKPLEWRVLDPSCGSGTFLFWAVRRVLDAADEEGLSNREALDLATDRVVGVDIHPVAVLIARVTYLLAFGTARLQADRGSISVPVYLGDSLQWNTRPFMADREVLIEVPDGGPVLAFPFAVTRDPGLFDRVIQEMLALSERGGETEDFLAWLRREQVTNPGDLATLSSTYGALRQLVADDRDHIWGYVAGNLSRPIWLSTEEQRADVVIGNPPWLSYRFMTDALQERFREQSIERGIWAGGRHATHQDLSALFFVRAIEFYLKPGGRIAFVMPLAALTRQQFAGFRLGVFMSAREAGMSPRRRPSPQVAVEFERPWAFDDRVAPLFPVPSAVVFATDTTPLGSPMPGTALAFEGILPRRDASPAEAAAALTSSESEVVALDSVAVASPYARQFRQGTTVVPQFMWVVTRARARLGGNPAEPVVESRRNALEKPPWRDLDGLRGPVEDRFLHPLLLGSSIAPYRELEPVEAILPWDDASGAVLTAESAGRLGFRRLANWLANAEELWSTHGRGSISLADRIDYHGALGTQMSGHDLRVVYAASGTQPAAAIVRDPRRVAESKLYWAGVETEDEAYYLAAVLNSETARRLTAHLQSRGQWGARDFHKVIFALSIPTFDATLSVHQGLATAARRAEELAQSVPIGGLYFPVARARIRAELVQDGIAATVDSLVSQLVGEFDLPEDADGASTPVDPEEETEDVDAPLDLEELDEDN